MQDMSNSKVNHSYCKSQLFLKSLKPMPVTLEFGGRVGPRERAYIPNVPNLGFASAKCCNLSHV